MKPQRITFTLQSLKDRGYIEHNNTFYPPNSIEGKRLLAQTVTSTEKKRKSLKSIKTGWIDDIRNLKNKEGKTDVFMRLVKQELNLEIWPEFYFDTERLYRFDYAIPEIMVAIEQEGGIWAKGKSGHSSGTGIMRDMAKSNLAQSKGWTVIRRTPDQMNTTETLNLIRKFIINP